MSTIAKLFGILFVSLLAAHVANAQRFYKWTDEQGNIHATTDPAQIPQEYREQALSKDSDSESSRGNLSIPTTSESKRSKPWTPPRLSDSRSEQRPRHCSNELHSRLVAALEKAKAKHTAVSNAPDNWVVVRDGEADTGGNVHAVAASDLVEAQRALDKYLRDCG